MAAGDLAPDAERASSAVMILIYPWNVPNGVTVSVQERLNFLNI